MDDETRREVLGEALLDEFKAIREYLEDIPTIKAEVRALRVDVDELKSDVKVIKSAVRHTSQEVRGIGETVGDHDGVLRVLKRKAA